MAPHPASFYATRNRRALTDRLGLAPDALPGGGNWFPEEDTLLTLLDQVDGREDCHAVVCGAGLSVAVLACALAGRGSVTALESDQRALAMTREMLASVGAESRLIHAELTEYDKHNLWYARWSLDGLPDRIDLLFIDGPGHFAGRMPRWPAGPELFHRLGPDSVVILDDAKRVKEKKALQRWAEAYPWLVDQKSKKTGGAVVLRRRGSD